MRCVAEVLNVGDPYAVAQRYTWEQLWLSLSALHERQAKLKLKQMHKKAGARQVMSLTDFMEQIRPKGN